MHPALIFAVNGLKTMKLRDFELGEHPVLSTFFVITHKLQSLHW